MSIFGHLLSFRTLLTKKLLVIEWTTAAGVHEVRESTAHIQLFDLPCALALWTPRCAEAAIQPDVSTWCMRAVVKIA